MRIPVTNADCRRFALSLKPRTLRRLNIVCVALLAGAFLLSTVALLAAVTATVTR